MDADYLRSLQALADTLGLSFNGTLSAKARKRRDALNATAAVPVPAPAPVAARAPQPAKKPAPVPRPAPLAGLPFPLARYSFVEAVHEAGHIVAALANGVRVHRATIVSQALTTRDSAPTAHANAVIAFAGPVAEALLCEGAPDPFASGAASGDLANLANLKLTPQAEAVARAEAERLVSVHREAIGRLARVLARWGTVDGAEAEALFRN